MIIWGRPDWEDLNLLKEEVGNWIEKLVQKDDSNNLKENGYLKHREMGLNISLKKDKYGFEIIDGSRNESGFKNENMYKITIKSRLEEKFNTVLQVQHPTILAMYLNGTFCANLPNLKNRIHRMLPDLPRNPFEEVWLIKEKEGIRVL